MSVDSSTNSSSGVNCEIDNKAKSTFTENLINKPWPIYW